MKRAVLAFALIGLGIPTVWMVIYHTSPMFAKWWLTLPDWVDTLRLVIWPSAILLVADPLDENIVLWVISAALNALLYAMLGAALLRVLQRFK
jgi:hypothetical protein